MSSITFITRMSE